MSLRSQAQIHFTPTVVLEMLNYLKHDIVPAGLSPSSIRRFQKRCTGITFVHNTLVFGTKTVIPTDQVEQKIKNVYDQKDTVGKGINQMVAHIQSLYLGISRKKIEEEVMKNQIVYQLSFHQKHLTLRSLASSLLASFFFWRSKIL